MLIVDIYCIQLLMNKRPLFADYFESNSKSHVHIDAETAGYTKVLGLGTRLEVDNTDDKVQIASLKEGIKENPRNYELRLEKRC